MPVTYDYDKCRKILTFVSSDPVMPEDWPIAWSQARNDPGVPFAEISRTILDFHKRKDLQIGDRLYDLVDQVARYNSTPHGRVAIVVSSTIGSAVFRMIDAYAERFMCLGVFRDVRAAVRWLMEGE